VFGVSGYRDDLGNIVKGIVEWNDRLNMRWSQNKRKIYIILYNIIIWK